MIAAHPVMARTVSFLAALLCALVFVLSVPATGEGSSVKDIRYYSAAGYTRVVLDLTGSSGYSINRLRNPDRLYVDLYGAVLPRSIDNSIKVLDGLLRNIRSSQYKSDTVRIVMDLEGIESYKIFRLSEPSRVVVDIFGEEGKSYSPQTGESPIQAIKKKWEEKSAPAVTEIDIYRVVIDAGHGGKDPGALGPGKAREKDIVLDIAKRVKRILEAQKGYEVILTRDRDVFLELEERTAIANKKDADLFVSIHANANRSRGLRGIETYFLNYTDEDEALKVAARENRISLKTMKKTRTEEGAILASLALEFNRNESLKLANYMQDSLVSYMRNRYKGIIDKGVKKALFYVLFGAKMPSVLVEASYITNRMEAARLASPSYRENLAKGIASGIRTYFSKSAPVQKIAKR